MKKLLWYKICPNCNEGRLFVFKKVNGDTLYLHCEECEQGYSDLNDKHSFLTLLEDFESEPATEEDIINSKWKNEKFNVLIE